MDLGNETQTALVTGATGYIGGRLAQRLFAEGWNVHVLIRPTSDRSALHDSAGNLMAHTFDGSTDELIRIMAAIRPAVVFHLASLFLAQHQSSDVEPLIRSNVLFSTQLVEAMAVNGLQRLVNTGTSWQHYESKEYNPVCLYAATKQAFATILQFYTETSSLKSITLKLFDTYGPDDPRPKLFTILRKIAHEQSPLDMSPGDQLIDLVYIDDVLDAYITAARLLLSNESSGHTEYAVSSGALIKLKDLINVYSRITRRTLPIVWGGRPYRPREVMIPWNKGTRLPGWKPKVTLEEGIRQIERIE
jgi:nucleoside-diphosphate-sugar epimerase